VLTARLDGADPITRARSRLLSAEPGEPAEREEDRVVHDSVLAVTVFDGGDIGIFAPVGEAFDGERFPGELLVGERCRVPAGDSGRVGISGSGASPVANSFVSDMCGKIFVSMFRDDVSEAKLREKCAGPITSICYKSGKECIAYRGKYA
jgi:hypothetical protein